jgi:membrane fusion protein, multidrug efflux system
MACLPAFCGITLRLPPERPFMKVSSHRIAISCVLACLIGLALWRLGAATGDAGKPGGQGDAVPVQVATVTRGPVDLSVSSVGTVLALNTVVLRPRIDAPIQSVRFREGQLVARGEVLIELDPLPFRAQLLAAKAQRDRDAALLENAKHDFERYDTLLQMDSTTAQTRDTALSTVHQLTATVANDDAQIDLAKLSLSYATIRAPFSGRIGARLVDAGNIVHVSDATGLAVLTQIQPITVTFALPQDRLPELRDAQRRGPVPAIASTQDGRQILDRGELTLIDNQIDAVTGTVRCKAVFPNSHDNLWPGQFVMVATRLRVLPQALTVPTSAVQQNSDGAFVYVVSNDLVARAQPVHLVGIQDDRSIIDSGLAGGERVVTEGHFRLESNARVRLER